MGKNLGLGRSLQQNGQTKFKIWTNGSMIELYVKAAVHLARKLRKCTSLSKQPMLGRNVIFGGVCVAVVRVESINLVV